LYDSKIIIFSISLQATLVDPEKFIFMQAPNALHLIWTICRQKSLAIVGQCAPNRWPVAGAKKADALFSDHAQQPADVEACRAQDCMQTVTD
jgi:hypothetical protein